MKQQTKYYIKLRLAQALLACLIGGGIALLIWYVSTMPLTVLVVVVLISLVCSAAWRNS